MSAEYKENTSWRESTSTWEVKWEQDDDVADCRQCNKSFGFFTRRHHCRACGRIFCFDCCKDWILLPEFFKQDEPQRVCIGCVRKHGALDMNKTEDVFGEENEDTIIMIPGGLTTRNSLIYLAEALSKQHRVITMDIPGIGSRRSEKLLITTCIEAVKSVIDKYCEDRKAIIFGYGVGGHIAMMFSRHHPSYCKGLILGGCSSEYPPISGRIFGGSLSLVFKLTPEDELWKIIPENCPEISKERLSRAILRDGVDYSKWTECSSMLTEAQEGTYMKCLALVPCRVLIFNGEHDYRKAEEKFMQVLGDKGTLLVVKDGNHYVFLDEVYIQELAISIFAYINQINEESGL